MRNLLVEDLHYVSGGHALVAPLPENIPDEDEDFYDECDIFPYNSQEKFYC